MESNQEKKMTVEKAQIAFQIDGKCYAADIFNLGLDAGPDH